MGRIVGKNNRDYYVIDDLRKNPELQTLFLECIQQVKDGNTKISKKYPPRLVMGPDDILNNSVLEFYLEDAGQKGLDYAEAKDFCERMRKLFGWQEIHYSLQKWVWRILRNPHYHNVERGKDSFYENWVRNEDDGSFEIREDVFKLACYIGICFMKYGASYDYLNANEIFGYVTDLGSKEVAKLKKYGSGELPLDVTEYKDDVVLCKANDAFATIKITVKKECESVYTKVLEFLCRLLEAGFPKSYAIDFKSPAKEYLTIKKLPKKGVHQLFANAVKYPALHVLMERFAQLAINEFEWYNNLQDENCAMPGTFAVFALGLESPDYLPLALHYLDMCDDEHSSIQEKFTAAYIEKFGFSDATLKVFINTALSMQWMSENKLYAAQMANAASLKALLDAKANLEEYVTPVRRYTDNDRKKTVYYASLWQTMQQAIWGKKGCSKQGAKVIAAAPGELRPLYEAVFVPFTLS